MKYTITFQDLPFVPEDNQVIYIENQYDVKWNKIIRENYNRLKIGFRLEGKEFVYLPQLLLEPDVEEKVRYYAPYLTSKIKESNLVHSTLLLRYMQNPENREHIIPSFIYHPHKTADDTIVFSGFTLDGLSCDWIGESMAIIASSRSDIKFSLVGEDDDGCCFRSIPNKDEEEILFDIRCKQDDSNSVHDKDTNSSEVKEQSSAVSRILSQYLGSPGSIKRNKKTQSDLLNFEEEEEEIAELIKKLHDTAQRLELKGVALAAIHELIDAKDPLSRMVITSDHRILLPDYNVEVQMPPMVKAVYFLFLNHPEGIRLKEIADYTKELFNYYKQLQTKISEPKMHVTIAQMCNPENNKLNEALSRIRYAFCERFDEHLAKNYYVSGTAGEPYCVPFDQTELLTWED